MLLLQALQLLLLPVLLSLLLPPLLVRLLLLLVLLLLVLLVLPLLLLLAGTWEVVHLGFDQGGAQGTPRVIPGGLRRLGGGRLLTRGLLVPAAGAWESRQVPPHLSKLELVPTKTVLLPLLKLVEAFGILVTAPSPAAAAATAARAAAAPFDLLAGALPVLDGRREAAAAWSQQHHCCKGHCCGLLAHPWMERRCSSGLVTP